MDTCNNRAWEAKESPCVTRKTGWPEHTCFIKHMLELADTIQNNEINNNINNKI